MDHGNLDTVDGLSEEDHQNGYHYYGGYKVMHVCQTCNTKRTEFGYDYGWYNTLECRLCEAKKLAKIKNLEYPENATETELWKLLAQKYNLDE